MTTITIVDSLWCHNEHCCYANMRSQGQAFVCWHLNLSVTCGTVVPRRWTCLSVILPYSTILVQVMAWSHQATSHYLSQCWPRSMSLMTSLGHNELININFHYQGISFKPNRHDVAEKINTIFHVGAASFIHVLVGRYWIIYELGRVSQ